MFGKVKALGLLTIAMLLMGAVLASAAHAETEFLPSAYPAIVTGEQISTEVHPEQIFSIGAFGSLDCLGVKFTTTVKQTDDHTQLTVKSTYSNCLLNGSPATITMNGCDLVVHVVSTMDIACSLEPKHVVIDVWKSMVTHLGGGETICQYTIAPQVGLKSTNLSNTVPGEGRKDVDLTFSVANIAIKRIQGSLLLCGPENPMGGVKYTGLVTLRAYEDVNGAEGKQIDFEA
jgi:hypothetical protein